METMYGCINENEFSLSSPRVIDGDECKSVEKAFAQALEMLQSGETDKVTVCKCKWYGDDNGNGYWGEVVGTGAITIDAYSAEWVIEDEEEEETC